MNANILNKLGIVIITFLFAMAISACNQKKDVERLAEFDRNGNPIIYSEEVYINMWIKNRDLKVTIIDTFCINQKAKAKKDIKNGKLIYFGSHQLKFPKMSKMLKKYGIETREYFGHCLRIGGFEPFCYQEEMTNEITRKHGSNFIDSIFRIVQKEYILENPDVEYMEDGIDLREKYIIKSNVQR